MEHNDNTYSPAISKVLHRLGLQTASGYSEMQDNELIATLSSPDESVRVTAVHMLGEKGAATELLVKAMQDERTPVRIAAIQALGKREGHIPVEPLIAALRHDPEWSVRAMAALILRTAGEHVPVEPFLDALHDEDESVRAAAARALGIIGERVPLKALENALHDAAWPVREAAALTLGELGKRVQVEQLLGTKDSDESVRQAGITLRQISPDILTMNTSDASLPRRQRYPRQGAPRVLRLVLLYCWTIFIGYLGSSIWNLYQLTHANPANVTNATVATAIANSFTPLTSGNIPLSVRIVFAALFVLLFSACVWAARDIWHERRSVPIQGTQANRFMDEQEKNSKAVNAQNHHRANIPIAEHQEAVFAKRRLSRRVVTVGLATIAIAGNSIVWSLLLHSLRNRQPAQPATSEGGPKSISFYGPGYSALDTQGNLYVLDADLQNTHSRILKLSPSGDVLAEWPFKQDTDPACIAIDGQGSIYLAVQGTNSIYTLSPTGALLPQWHVSGARPTALTLDKQGNIYVALFYENTVQKYSSTGKLLKFWGTSSNQSQFYHPAGVAVDGKGNIYVVDQGNGRIQKLAPVGNQATYFGTPGDRPGQFLAPGAIAVDTQGNVYVTDGTTGLVQKFSPTGKLLTAWGTNIPGSVQFGIPRGIAVDAQGNIYVSSADSDGSTFTNGRITVLSPSSKVLAIWK